MEAEKEEWRDIEGYIGLYQVSTWGRVKSLNYNKTGKERILKLRDNGRGYLFVSLCKDGKSKQYYIHRLIACAFIPNPHGYNEINHLDECKSNNFVENLEWCSKSHNVNYGTRNKRMAEKLSLPVIGIDCTTGLILEFPSIREASRQTGTDKSHICACCKGKLKSSGGYIWHYLEDQKED